MRRSILRPLCLVFMASLLCLALAACEIEEEVRLEADGSGTHRVKISVEKQMAGALSELPGKLKENGFSVVEEGETADRKFIVLSRSFQDVTELDDKGEGDSYQLTVERTSPLTAYYRLALDFRSNASANGFKRTLRVFMPAHVESASTGTVDGDSVLWDCSHPGRLEVQAAGLAPTLTSGQRRIALAVLAGGVLLIFGMRVARRAAPSCASCGNRLEAAALFCPTCGAPRPGAPIPAASAEVAADAPTVRLRIPPPPPR